MRGDSLGHRSHVSDESSDRPAVPLLHPHLRTIPDPRQPSRQRHPLKAILAQTCTAMLVECDSLLAIAEWGHDPQAGAPLAARLDFTRARTTCVATLHRVFRRLDVAAFNTAVRQCAAATAALGTRATPAGIAVDGKALRGCRHSPRSSRCARSSVTSGS